MGGYTFFRLTSPWERGNGLRCRHMFLGLEFAASASKRQAFFSQFSRRILESLPKGPTTPLIALTGGFRTYATINSALASGHTELVGIGRLSIHAPHAPIQLEAEKHGYVPPPPSDFTVSIFDRLWDELRRLTGVKVPLLVGATREICWYMMQMENLAAFTPFDYGASGFGAMIMCAGGVKIRPTGGHKLSSWMSWLYALFAVLFSWLGCLALGMQWRDLFSYLYIVPFLTPSGRPVITLGSRDVS